MHNNKVNIPFTLSFFTTLPFTPPFALFFIGCVIIFILLLLTQSQHVCLWKDPEGPGRVQPRNRLTFDVYDLWNFFKDGKMLSVSFNNFWAWRNHDVWVLLLHKVFDYDLAYSAFKFQVFMLHKVYIPGLSFHGHFYILSDDFIKRALICI